jgi:hypothetical protein
MPPGEHITLFDGAGFEMSPRYAPFIARLGALAVPRTAIVTNECTAIPMPQPMRGQ